MEDLGVGTSGDTGLLGNVRVGKDVVRIEAYGTVDEANAAIGILLAHLPQAAQEARPWLTHIQSDLMIIGTLVAFLVAYAVIAVFMMPL